MESYYTYTVKVHFKLKDAEFDLLTEAMKNHSDCEYYTKQGEFWYGNMNRRHWAKEDGKVDGGEYSATTSQLDRYVIKSLEPFVNYSMGNKEKQSMGAKLYFDLMKLLSDAIAHHNMLAEAQNEFITE